MSKIFDTVKSALVDNITNLNNPLACDLHHHLYNETPHFIHYDNAEEATAELGVWQCIGVVQTYEKQQFGELYTKLSDACKVANLVVYIMGDVLLDKIYSDTEYFADKWDEKLSDDDLAQMLIIAETWFEENPDGLEKIWGDLDIA